jgi:hypothetical protein
LRTDSAITSPRFRRSARVTPLGALALLVLSYGATLLAPQLPRFQRMLALPQREDFGTLEAWLPLASAVSLILGSVGVAWMTLKRMQRDFQRQPCLAIGAALVAAIGLVLIALRAPLSLFGQPSGALAVMGLALSLLGGAFVQRGGGATALLGALLTAVPLAISVLAVSLLGAPGVAMKEAFIQLGEQNRLFLILLAVAGVLMTVMALVARALLDDREHEWTGYEPERPVVRSSLSSSSWGERASGSWVGAAALRASRTFEVGRARFAGARATATRKLKTLWNTKAGEAPPLGFSVWRYHDTDTPEEAQLAASLRRSANGSWPLVWLVLVLVLAAVAVAAWAAYS